MTPFPAVYPGMRTVICCTLALFLASCATPYAGRNLPQGTSMSQVEATMGKPAETLVDSGGYTVWFYPTTPEGRDTWAARFMPDGRLVAVEQRLSKEYISRVVPGTTTQKQVRELLGPPKFAYPAAQLPLVEWDYSILLDYRYFDFLVRFSSDGVVREAYLLHDPIYDTGDRGR